MASPLARRVAALEAAAPARRGAYMMNTRGEDNAATIARRFPDGVPADVDLIWVRWQGGVRWGTASSDGNYSGRPPSNLYAAAYPGRSAV